MKNQICVGLPAILLLIALWPLAGTAQTVADDDYQRAESMLSWNLSDKTFRMAVQPNWLNSSQFWYRLDTRRGIEYMFVDAEATEKRPAFNHERLAQELERVDGVSADPWNLRLGSLSFSDDLGTVYFDYNRKAWSCTLQAMRCEAEEQPNHGVAFSVTSPNGQLAAFTRDHNLWVRDLTTGEDRQLTTDGEEFYSYARNNQGWSRSDRPILLWSPDSKKIATFRLDERGVEKMVLWRAQEGRPEADIWPYALPGDTVVPMLERVVVDVEAASVIDLDVDPSHQRASNCCGLTRGFDWVDNEWSADSKTLAFVATSRDYKEVDLYLADAETGAVRHVHADRDEIFFESNLTSRGVPNWRVLHDSGEFIWFNRSDNWGHLYLHDLETGALKNRITSGSWNVVDILHINEEERVIYFTGVNHEEGRDPYFEHLYKIGFDGAGMTLLTPENFHHDVWLGPEADYFVQRRSDFQTPPVSALRTGDGEEVMVLEEADVTDLMETGWQAPIPVTTKARDGETDIYGFMILPSNFDPNKRYPIVNSIYPGPQAGSVGSRSFSQGRRGQAHALAELGFVVVAMDAFGSSPIRSRDFHTYYSGNMIDNGLEDQIAAMKQLAEEHDFIDLDRAGIYGHSGGGFATAAALTQYPEFFKVGVSGAGNHDNRGYTYYWGEKYQGLLAEQNGEDNFAASAIHEYAANLEGKLLLSYGTMDTNVHPAMTQLFIDALIRENKDFDLIVMPNRGHGFANEPYKIRRTWDYFVRHLIGTEPPHEYRINR
ncbi:MAG: DPP IV N-terminal domain-containing protein [Balneolaceae bacterium]